MEHTVLSFSIRGGIVSSFCHFRYDFTVEFNSFMHKITASKMTQVHSSMFDIGRLF